MNENKPQIISMHQKITSFKKGQSYTHLHTEHIASVIGADVKYDGIYDDKSPTYVYLGADYFPVLPNGKEKAINLYGGLTEAYYKYFEKFALNKATSYILDYPVPKGFLNALVKRAENKSASTYKGAEVEVLKELRNKCLNSTVVTQEDLVTESNSNMMFGDSHSISMTPGGVPCTKIGGRTLFGAVKNNVIVNDFGKTKAKHILLMMGSIDIRHHMFRQEDPFGNMKELLNAYMKQCIELVKNGKSVEICAPVPIETETRKFSKDNAYPPRSGIFFHGSREERLSLTLFFIDEIRRLIAHFGYNESITLSTYPEEWYTMNPADYETKMERVKGSHVSMLNCRRLNFGKIGDENDEHEEW